LIFVDAMKTFCKRQAFDWCSDPSRREFFSPVKAGRSRKGHYNDQPFCHSSTRRAGGGTSARHTDISWRNLLGPAPLAGASVSIGEGQPNFPGEQRRKTSAPPKRGVAVFFLFSFSYGARAVPSFFGGTFLVSSSLCLSFNSFALCCFSCLAFASLALTSL
jgi:hypothetical protein